MTHGSFSPVEAPEMDGATGRIRVVGSLAHVQQIASPPATTVDLSGECLFHGFVEPHLHLGLTALIGDLFVGLSPPRTTTVEEAITAL
jgi:predicted amidohydrolase YtcJ